MVTEVFMTEHYTGSKILKEDFNKKELFFFTLKLVDLYVCLP